MIHDNEDDTLLKVPVIIVGSHYDKIEPSEQKQKLASVQTVIDELKEKYVPRVYIVKLGCMNQATDVVYLPKSSELEK